MKKLLRQIVMLLGVVTVVGIVVGVIAAFMIAGDGSQSMFAQVIIITLTAIVCTVTTSLVIMFLLGPKIAPDLLIGLAEIFLKKSRHYRPPRDFDSRRGSHRFVSSRLGLSGAHVDPYESGIKSLSRLSPSGTDAELWVVASGKGGVGKSLISLGLVEDLSRNGPVLLLDFDLHNCGLTSLLDLRDSGSPNSAYSLLDDFRKMLDTEECSDPTFKNLLDEHFQLPPDFTIEHFNTIKEKFQRDCRDKPCAWDNLHRYSILDPRLPRISSKMEKIPVVGEPTALNPLNAFIMPSRVADQQLLLKPVSTLSYIVAFLFLRALCFWLSRRVGIIILDCHGSHDTFTAASILAAQKLVVVTTTDPGSYDGTLELLDAVNTRTKLGIGAPEDTVIVFNNCPVWDEEIPEPIDKAIEELKARSIVKSRGTVKITDNYQLRETMKEYEFGHISQQRQLWQKIREITELLLPEGEKEKFTQEYQPNPVVTAEPTLITRD